MCGPAKRHYISNVYNTVFNFKKHLDTIYKAMKLVRKEPAKENQSRDGAKYDNGTPRIKQHCAIKQISHFTIKVEEVCCWNTV